ncbi:thioredoxin family protein [Rhodoferax sp.]|uniref:thioredoxin family protein n=1 Tax=Rhodoferax sp. TaxID=50421 RepID=UPI0027460CDF|nr:thioredoxin family protein [Rhodoferax sp.]
MNTSHTASPPCVLVACLCAEWCGVCHDYRERFEQLQAKFPHARFIWIDVEDQADLLHPLDDVDNFPTLLLAVGDEPRFFGPVVPSIESLERLIRGRLYEAGATAMKERAVVDLLVRIRTAHALA